MARSSVQLEKLVERFVETFCELDGQPYVDSDPLPNQLFSYIEETYFEGHYQYHYTYWKPARLTVLREGLNSLRQHGTLPRAFEFLATHYAWLEVDLVVLRLFKNPPGPDLETYIGEMFRDPVMNHTLLPARYIRFGLATDSCYDAICFDLNRMEGDDCPIVQIEHESVLCHDKIGDMTTIYPSFQALMEHVIDLATAK